MKILMVHVGPINKYPPVLSVMQYMSDLGFEIILCSTDIDDVTRRVCVDRNIGIIDIPVNYEKPIPAVLKVTRWAFIRHRLWAEIDNVYDKDTIIWVFSGPSLRHLGKRLLDTKYILHMFELNRKSIFYHRIPQIALQTEVYARNALGVIQAEYNRAQISKTWWGLESLPYVLPNKPYDSGSLNKDARITDKVAAGIIGGLRGRKIVLYQGILTAERPLEPFINAIKRLGDEYALVVMSGDRDIYNNVDADNLYFIPFVAPPYHLEVTSKAHIGILTYTPVNRQLNALYCAPNKLYEYSMFGIPMIGNDIPGLKYIFDAWECGICFKDFSSGEIIKAVKAVEADYATMSLASKQFYDNTNMKQILSNIMNDIHDKVGTGVL